MRTFVIVTELENFKARGKLSQYLISWWWHSEVPND